MIRLLLACALLGGCTVTSASSVPMAVRRMEFSAPKLDITDLAKQPADVRALITAVLALDSREGDPLYGRVDTGKVAVGGHSLGGMTSVGLVSSYARDRRVSAVIVLAGSARTVGTDYPDTDASMFFVHGDRDTVVSPADGRAAYDPHRGPKAWLRLEYGDHVAPYFGTDRSDSARVSRATTDYLLWSLRGDIEALKRLNSTVDIGSRPRRWRPGCTRRPGPRGEPADQPRFRDRHTRTVELHRRARHGRVHSSAQRRPGAVRRGVVIGQCAVCANRVGASDTAYVLTGWVRGNNVYLGVTGGASTSRPTGRAGDPTLQTRQSATSPFVPRTRIPCPPWVPAANPRDQPPSPQRRPAAPIPACRATP